MAGELFGLVRAPLVGQIVVGLLLGPGLLDLVRHSEAFALVGLVGLLLLVEGGGLHLDLNTLRASLKCMYGTTAAMLDDVLVRRTFSV